MSEIYCVLTIDGCFEPYSSIPADRIIPEHRAPQPFVMPERPAPPVPPPPSDMEKEESRKAIMRNLLRIGHPIEEIESVYGKF